MILPSRYWSDLTTRQFAHIAGHADIGNVVAVLPVAATEQHGPHLPVSVDADLLNGVIAAAIAQMAEALPVLFLPAQIIGKSNEHIRFPGTLTLSAQTIIALWMEMGASVARAGIRKLLIFNSHGGQASVMDIVARDLRSQHDLIVCHSNWYNPPLLDPQGEPVARYFPPEEHRFGIHGGDMETSMMLALNPARVDMAQAQNFRTSSQDRSEKFPVLGNGATAKLGWQMQDYNAMGAAGHAAAATAEKGRILLDAAGRQLAGLLADISALPLSTLVDRPDFSGCR